MAIPMTIRISVQPISNMMLAANSAVVDLP
jgi:hypothetical protein